jgi:hypothetical protein
VRPRSTEDVVSVLRACNDDGVPVLLPHVKSSGAVIRCLIEILRMVPVVEGLVDSGLDGGWGL